MKNMRNLCTVLPLYLYYFLSQSYELTMDINVHMCSVFAQYLHANATNEEQRPVVTAMVNYAIENFQNTKQVNK